MNARNGQPKPGEADVPAAGGESDSVQRLRMQLAGLALQLAESEGRHREAEARLSSADGRLAACLDGMVDGVVIDSAIRDETGRIVDFRIEYANEAFSRLSGLTHEELVGHRILELFPGRRANGQFDAYVRVVETGEPLVRNSIRDHEVSDRSDPDGFGRDFEVSVTKLGDGYVATMHDNMARRRSEDELFRAQQMLRLVLDTIPQRVFWKDTHGVFVGCNAAHALDAGLTDPSEIVGKTDYELPWRDLAHDYIADDSAVMSSGLPKLSYDERQGRADGGHSWVRVSKVPLLDEDGRVVGILGTYEDITDRRALQEQLLQSQKMEGIGRLAGGVAHDFNNLLTAILGYVEMCKFDLPPDLPPDHPARLDLLEVALAGERAASLTRQLLAFASRQIVAPVRLDLSVLVADLLKMLQRLLGDDIEIETALDPSVGTVEADPGQIQQLLVNLTVNARDAMPDGGRLLIETADETVDDEQAEAYPGAMPGQYVVLAVADTGVGMTEEVRSHLFEPFFTTKELGKGTGLGLATCHGIVRQMGGHIRLYSEPGRGTTFRIYLPRKIGAADPQPVPAPPRPSPTGVETVLVVEDEPNVRRLAVLGLRAHGYVVLEAADGGEAIEIATHVGTTIEVIVSDVMMPGMSGPELLNRLSTIAPQARAVLMSGQADSTVLSQESALGCAFLPKPFTPERLARKVREVLDTSQPG